MIARIPLTLMAWVWVVLSSLLGLLTLLNIIVGDTFGAAFTGAFTAWTAVSAWESFRWARQMDAIRREIMRAKAANDAYFGGEDA